MNFCQPLREKGISTTGCYRRRFVVRSARGLALPTITCRWT